MPDVRAMSQLEDQRWRPVPSPAPTSRASPAVADAGSLPIVLVLFAVLFNAGLAIINAHVTPISANAVIGMEVSIVLAAHAIILWHYRSQMLPWYGMIVVIVLFSLERALVVGQFDPKFARDVLLIPTFVLLGMTTPPRRLTTLIVALHIIVVGGVLFEACFTQAYSDLFDVRQYYVATRPFEDTDFWNRSSDLFVSATRPGERFFSFVDLHRTSSVFLEPVSLGNYVIIITAFLCANYRHLTLKVLTFLLLGNLIALVGCDGRLATVSSMIVVLVTLVATRLPPKSALLYLPAVLVGALIIFAIHHESIDGAYDDFSGRVAYGVDLLTRFDIFEWFGNSNRLVGPAADSGIAYTITTQSIFGLMAFWVFLVLNAAERTPEQIKYLHALCVFIVLTLLVSYSLFSIKTAALLWFIHGSFQMSAMPRTSAVVRASRERRDSGMRAQLGQRPI
jgi:putative polymerase